MTRSIRNAFVDSNILVYAADESLGANRKRTIARKLLRTPDLHISVQVLNEFVASARHPRKLALSTQAESDWLSAWFRLSVSTITVEMFIEAIRIHHEHQLSHWDSLIVATALSLGCSILLSEDMQHTRNIEGLEIINPFL